jgi:hypothetical protein
MSKMTEETIKKFKEYKFSEDSRWQKYLQDLYPTPPLDKLNKLRKKWYKTNVDTEFDPEHDFEAQEQAQQQGQSSPSHSHTHQHHHTGPVDQRPFATHKLYHIEGLLKCLFIVTSFILQFLEFLHFYNLVIGAIICILAIYRQQGKIQFNKEYLADLMANDFGMSIFYIFSILTVPAKGPFIYLPLILQFLVGVAEFELRTTYGFLKFSKVHNFLTQVQQMKGEIKTARAYIEFFNLFYFVVLAVLGKINILFLIIYVNFIKFKFKLNQTSNYTLTNTKTFLQAKAAAVPAVGRFLVKAVDGLFWLITF